MNLKQLNILPEDEYSRFFFKYILKVLPVANILSIVEEGEKYLEYLFKYAEKFQDVLFPGLNSSLYLKDFKVNYFSHRHPVSEVSKNATI